MISSEYIQMGFQDSTTFEIGIKLKFNKEKSVND